jgi:hypothetical protein
MELLRSESGLESTCASLGDDWNDAKGRTVEEVHALLDRAIALAEATP